MSFKLVSSQKTVRSLQMMAAYSDFLFNIGMLDENQAAYFQEQTDKALDLIKDKQFAKAFKVKRNIHWSQLYVFSCSSRMVG